MALINSEALYKKIKENKIEYDEATLCPLVIDVMNNPREGTMSAICRKALISESKFWHWCEKYPILKECYLLGKIIAKSNWEQEGEDNLGNPDFDFDYWKSKGASRFNVGKQKIHVEVNPESNPFEQYKQVCDQARQGEFTAAELKQVMESINVGLRAYESHELQKQLDEMKNDVLTMRVNNGDITCANEITPKVSQNTLPN